MEHTKASVINKSMNIFSLEAVPRALPALLVGAGAVVAVLLSVAAVAPAKMVDGDDDGQNNHDADRPL